MKRSTLLILTIVVVALGTYFLLSGKKNQAAKEDKPVPLAVTGKSGAFNESFNEMLTAYFNMKDAFVSSDTVQANAAAVTLLKASDSLNVDEIRGDSTGTIRSLVSDLSATVGGSCKALLGEADIENKRREFQMISTAMWDLIRTSRYDGEKIYKLFCPMAFDNSGAEWLSNQSSVQNPYFGEKMPDCGSVEDSVDYSKQ